MKEDELDHFELAVLALQLEWKEWFQKLKSEKKPMPKEGALIRTLDNQVRMFEEVHESFLDTYVDVFVGLGKRHKMDFNYLFGVLAYRQLSKNLKGKK